MAATWSTVTAYAPELASVGAAQQAAFLDLAARLTNRLAYETDADNAESLMAAHLATMAKAGASGGSGPITGMSVGSVSVSYGTPAEAEGSLGSTAYGRILRMFQRRLMLSPFSL